MVRLKKLQEEEAEEDEYDDDYMQGYDFDDDDGYDDNDVGGDDDEAVFWSAIFWMPWFHWAQVDIVLMVNSLACAPGVSRRKYVAAEKSRHEDAS